MNNLLENQFVTTTINKAVHTFLYQIGLHSQQNLFDRHVPNDFKIRYERNNAFFLINPNYDNDSFVSSEKYLEGCIRVFLVNPIIKALLDHFGYRNDWMFGDTFNYNFSITNREFELGAFVEFIFECDGKAIGCRYTHPGYHSHEDAGRDRDFRYEYKKERIPGFDKINTVDLIYNIDWSGIASSELATIHRLPPELPSRHKDITLEDFFSLFFSRDSYLIFLEECKKAISRAKAILSVKAVPQLMPTNMLAFKDSVLQGFKEKIASQEYIFSSENPIGRLTNEDLTIINSSIFEDGMCEAIIGTSLFSKSFITSEYLFRTIDERLEIDYTTVVAGYLKSIEQLLYLLYLSAFGKESGIYYWDICNKSDKFDLSKEQYRCDPYCIKDKPELQEFYYHKKRTGVKAPTFGSLIHFIRYNPDTWKISETGKEYVCSCLEDYRSFCRNHHFHKDNIEQDNYGSVVRIRNNTYVCLYYLLGGFRFLNCWDDYRDIKDAIGIRDYSFERLFNSIPRKRGLWKIRTSDGCERTGFFSILDYDPDYDRFDPKTIQIIFIESTENEFWDRNNDIMFDTDYLSSHRVILTSDLMPIEFTRLRRPRKENK